MDNLYINPSSGGASIGSVVTGASGDGLLYPDHLNSEKLTQSTTTPTATGLLLAGTTTLIASAGAFNATFPEKTGVVAMTSDVGGVTIGQPVSGGTNNLVLYQDGTGKLHQASGLAFDGANLTIITPSAGDNSTKAATTAYVDNAGIQTAQVSLSSSQILNLNTTPVTLVAAPGSGKLIQVISAIWDYTFVSTAYSNTAVSIYCNTNSVNPICTFVGGVLISTSSIIKDASWPATNVQGGTLIDNAPIIISGGVNPTTGDGTAKVTLLYKIITR